MIYRRNSGPVPPGKEKTMAVNKSVPATSSRLRRVSVGPILGGSRGLDHWYPANLLRRGRYNLLAPVIHINRGTIIVMGETIFGIQGGRGGHESKKLRKNVKSSMCYVLLSTLLCFLVKMAHWSRL